MTTYMGIDVIPFVPDVTDEPKYTIEWLRTVMVNPMGKSLYRNLNTNNAGGRITYDFDVVMQSIAERRTFLDWFYTEAQGRKGRFWFTVPYQQDISIHEAHPWLGGPEWFFHDTGLFEAYEMGRHRRYFSIIAHALGGVAGSGASGSGFTYVMLSGGNQPFPGVFAAGFLNVFAGLFSGSTIQRKDYSPIFSRMYLMRCASDDLTIEHHAPGLAVAKMRLVEVPSVEYPT